MNSIQRRFAIIRVLVLVTMASFELAACAHLTFETEQQWQQPWYVRWFAKSDGIHYYRPKPYLLVTESITEKTAASGTGGGAAGQASAAGQTTESCVAEIKYLPDYTQESVIIPHYWLGSVALKPTLTDGWNLTNFDSTVDTKIPETITAIANLAKAVQPSGLAIYGGRQAPPPGGLRPGLYAIVPSDSGGLALDTASPVFQATGTVCERLMAVAKPAPSPAAPPTK